VNLQNIDLKLLVFLDALLNEKSVTIAASKVHISQPAMSNALNKLRSLLNDPILVRSSQGMLPTRRALDIHLPLKKALAQLGETLAPIESFDPTTTDRVLSLTLTDYASTVLLPKLIPLVKEEAPLCDFKIWDESQSLSQLESGAVDFAINAFGALPDTFYKKTLWQESYLVIARKNHPQLTANLDLTSYLALEHILLTKSGIGPGTVDTALKENQLDRRVAIRTKHFHLAPQLVEGSNMIATLPAKLAIYFKMHYQIETYTPPLELPAFNYSLVWSAIAHHDPALRWLKDKIIKAADLIPHFPLCMDAS